jgi:hypothetical protein
MFYNQDYWLGYDESDIDNSARQERVGEENHRLMQIENWLVLAVIPSSLWCLTNLKTGFNLYKQTELNIDISIYISKKKLWKLHK